MPKRELTETEKALRQEQLVECKMMAVAMRLNDPMARSLVAQRVYERLLSAAYPRLAGQSLGPTPLRVTRIDAREAGLSASVAGDGPPPDR